MRGYARFAARKRAPSPIDMTSCLANIFHRHFGGFFCREVKKYVRDMSAARLTGDEE
jgi:hypothetical protein